MLLAILLLCLNLLLVQGPVFGWAPRSEPQVGDLMDRRSAQDYMVFLINRDRKAVGLEPVELDLVASAAGQAHSDEMALARYVSHWDLRGRKPDQRYCEAGGEGAVSENVLITHDFAEKERYTLAPRQMFSRRELESIEELFLNELPPDDGHRRNILSPDHNRVGIGLTLVLPGGRVVCTQEFVNQYGSFSKLPAERERGQALALSGRLDQGLSLCSVDIYREAQPEPMTADQLRATHSYNLPTDSVVRYYPPPYPSPARMNLSHTAQGENFAVEVKPGQHWKPGLYYVLVWARKPDSKTPFVTSSQTVAIN